MKTRNDLLPPLGKSETKELTEEQLQFLRGIHIDPNVYFSPSFLISDTPEFRGVSLVYNPHIGDEDD